VVAAKYRSVAAFVVCDAAPSTKLGEAFEKPLQIDYSRTGRRD
jgi:hypothetical protein